MKVNSSFLVMSLGLVSFLIVAEVRGLTGCDEAISLAREIMPTNCGNQATCPSSDCSVQDGGLAVGADCQGDKVYCVNDVCGSYITAAGFADSSTVSGGHAAVELDVYFQFTSGGTGTVKFEILSIAGFYGTDQTCSVEVDGQQCTSCVFNTCQSGDDGVYVDCNNLGQGILDECNNYVTDGSVLFTIEISDLDECNNLATDSSNSTTGGTGSLLQGTYASDSTTTSNSSTSLRGALFGN